MHVLFFCNSFQNSRYARQHLLKELLPEFELETIILDQPVRVIGPPDWILRQHDKEFRIREAALVVHWPISFQERRSHLSSRLYSGREYIERSWVVFEQALFTTLPPTQQLNPYSKATFAANKVSALATATRHGIKAPKFLISNDATAIAGFLTSHPGIVKVITDTNRIDFRSKFFPIRAEPDLPADELSVLPQLLQEEITAIKEVRSYYFSGDVHVVEATRDPTHPAIDVRLQEMKGVQWTATSHSAVEALTHCLASLFGLNFFSADFLEPADSEPLFLDINPHASWDWMNRPIVRQLDEAFAGSLRRILQSKA